MDTDETGRRGEQAAARYYLRHGYTLLAHNFRQRVGEIDLILRDPEGVIVFCEVKTRTDPDSLCRPADSVTRAKRRRLIRTAVLYLQQTEQSDAFARFDVAEVTPLDSGRWMVHIIKSAFDTSDDKRRTDL